MVGAPARREAALYAVSRGLSMRVACALVGTPRSTLKYQPRMPARDAPLAAALRELSRLHPAWGHRLVWAALRNQGWKLNHKRVERLWRKEGLSQPRRRSRKKTTHRDPVVRGARPNEVWTCDFIEDTLRGGQRIRCLSVVDEFTRECLALDVGRRMPSVRVKAVLERLAGERGAPDRLRSDNGGEFVARRITDWARTLSCQPSPVAPGKPWQNGMVESFHSRLRAECLDRETFASLAEARVVLENWRRMYNEIRPHSQLGYIPPAAFAASAQTLHEKVRRE